MTLFGRNKIENKYTEGKFWYKIPVFKRGECQKTCLKTHNSCEDWKLELNQFFEIWKKIIIYFHLETYISYIKNAHKYWIVLSENFVVNKLYKIVIKFW